MIAFLGLMSTSSCHKKKQHTSVKVIVLKASDGLPAVGASVRVYANVSGTTVDDTQTSDVNGEAFFSYDDIFQLGQASVAILDVKCTYVNKVGSGVVKVESEKETPITISVL
jgi:hypothetical protein